MAHSIQNRGKISFYTPKFSMVNSHLDLDLGRKDDMVEPKDTTLVKIPFATLRFWCRVPLPLCRCTPECRYRIGQSS